MFSDLLFVFWVAATLLLAAPAWAGGGGGGGGVHAVTVDAPIAAVVVGQLVVTALVWLRRRGR